MHTDVFASLDDLVTGLKSTDVETRVESAWALAEFEEKAAPALHALLDALRDNEPRVVFHVCDSLRVIGKNSADVTNALRSIHCSSNNLAIKEEVRLTLIAIEEPLKYEDHISRNRSVALYCCILTVVLLVAAVTIFLKFR